MIRTKKFTNMAFQETGAVDLSLKNTPKDLVKEAAEDKPEPSKKTGAVDLSLKNTPKDLVEEAHEDEPGSLLLPVVVVALLCGSRKRASTYAD